MGRLATYAWVTVCEDSTFCVSSSGASVVTTTSVAAEAAGRAESTVSTWPTVSVRFLWVQLGEVRGCRGHFIVWPDCRKGRVKLPAPFVVTLCTAPVSVFVITTAALGIAAPVLSVTVPVMVPVAAVCAAAGNATRASRAATQRTLLKDRTKSCHWHWPRIGEKLNIEVKSVLLWIAWRFLILKRNAMPVRKSRFGSGNGLFVVPQASSRYAKVSRKKFIYVV